MLITMVTKSYVGLYIFIDNIFHGDVTSSGGPLTLRWSVLSTSCCQRGPW